MAPRARLTLNYNFFQSAAASQGRLGAGASAGPRVAPPRGPAWACVGPASVLVLPLLVLSVVRLPGASGPLAAGPLRVTPVGGVLKSGYSGPSGAPGTLVVPRASDEKITKYRKSPRGERSPGRVSPPNNARRRGA